MSMEPVIAIAEHELAIINAARSVLDQLEGRLRRVDTADAGRCAEAVAVASSAAFHALNILHAYGAVPMTAAQLHNNAAAEVKA